MCDLSDMCWDESSTNNNLSCVESRYCRKLVAYFQIKPNNNFYDSRRCLLKNNEKFSTVLLDTSAKTTSILKRDAKKLDHESADIYVGNAILVNSRSLKEVSLPTAMIDFHECDLKVEIARNFIFIIAFLILFTLVISIVITIILALKHYRLSKLFLVSLFMG